MTNKVGKVGGHLGGSVGEVSAFSSGHDLRILGSSPMSGSLISRESLVSLPLPPLVLSPSLVNKIFFFYE